MNLLCSDMAEGGRDSSGPLKVFFRLQREPDLKSGRILVIIRMLRDSWLKMAALSAGAARTKLFRGAATHPIYATITLNCSANAR